MSRSLAALRCACPCGCTRTTRSPDVGSPVLARRARCSTCSDPIHRASHAAEPAPTRRPVTVTKPASKEEAALDARILAEQQAEIRSKELSAWQERLPEKFQHARTDNPRVKEALARWANGQPGTAGLVILGDTGRGKTWTALGYANVAIEAGLVRPGEILYGTEAELLAAAANSTFSEVDANLRRLTDRRYRMLVIDDVGRGPWLRDDMRQKVFALVADSAWRDNKVVVITTNLANRDLTDYVGEAAMDRLGSGAGYKSTVFLASRDEHMRRAITEEALRRS